MRIEKGHHGFFVRSVAIAAGALGAMFVTISESGFVAMMAIGNDQFLRGHGSRNIRNRLRIEYGPDAVHHTIFVFNFSGGLAGMGARHNLVDQAIDVALRIGIKHKKLPGMRAGVAQEFQAIGLGPGMRQFVAKQ